MSEEQFVQLLEHLAGIKTAIETLTFILIICLTGVALVLAVRNR